METKTQSLHISGHCASIRWPRLTQKQVWKIFSDVIAELQTESDLTTHAFVLMGNHYHWICSYDHYEESTLFEWFHERISLEFLEKSQEYLGAIFDGPPTVISLDKYYLYKNAYRYVYRNPVAAQIVVRAETYPFSTLSHMLQGKRLRFKCIDNMNLIANPATVLEWINGQDAIH